MSTDIPNFIPIVQRSAYREIIRSIEKEPNFDQLNETALQCYKNRFFSKKSSFPLVIQAMHLDCSKLVEKFHEIDQESKEWSLNKLIMHVALNSIKSPQIRDCLFSKATKEELSEVLEYLEESGNIFIQNTILHVAIEKGDNDLRDRLMEKKVDLDVLGEKGHTAKDLAELKGSPLKIDGKENLFERSPLNEKFPFEEI